MDVQTSVFIVVLFSEICEQDFQYSSCLLNLRTQVTNFHFNLCKSEKTSVSLFECLEHVFYGIAICAN